MKSGTMKVLAPKVLAPIARIALSVFVAGAAVSAADAADFDWKKFQGKTVTFLANNNPVSQALLAHKADFEKLTGITLKVDGYQEQQMRQRLVTVMNAHSDDSNSPWPAGTRTSCR
jgi:multiple sugar transport system substrate-binding protein